MIAAVVTLGVVACAALAWDFGRRWIEVRRGANAVGELDARVAKVESTMRDIMTERALGGRR